MNSKHITFKSFSIFSQILVASSIVFPIHTEKNFSKSKKHFFVIRSRKKFLRIIESFFDLEKGSLIERNRFVYIKEHFFESRKLSLIPRSFFLEHILKKFFFGCIRSLLHQ